MSPTLAGRQRAASSAAQPSLRAYRVPAIDIARGLVIVVMALDHVRDYFVAGSVQDPMSDPMDGKPEGAPRPLVAQLPLKPGQPVLQARGRFMPATLQACPT